MLVLLALILLVVGVRQCIPDGSLLEVSERVDPVELPMIDKPLPDLYLNEQNSLDWER